MCTVVERMWNPIDNTSTVELTIIGEQQAMSPEQAAENWNLPLRSIYEVIHYCESHRELLKLEADEERYRLEEKGVSLEPMTTLMRILRQSTSLICFKQQVMMCLLLMKQI